LKDLVYLESDKGNSKIASLFLNRPEKMNAFSLQMLEELLLQLEALSTHAAEKKVSCLLVRTTNSKAFCAGADLSERIKMNVEEVSQTLALQRKVMDRLSLISCPTIAVIQGLAFGGGLELALCCDLRIASKQALLGLTETKLAIIPGAGGTQRLTRILGPALAKQLIFRGQKLNAGEAHQAGLVNAVSENADQEALAWAAEIVEGGPVALEAAKMAIDGGMGLELNLALDFERKAYEKVLHTEDRIEGLKAFVEKRKPAYKGL
jgi:methylglutaconyl-CoA hydratase